MIKLVKQIPNLLTLTNLFLGCAAIVQTFSERTHIACLLIFAAAILDFLDGFVARALDAQSEMGKQLDSFADCVTFGVVPGMILYQLLANSFVIKANAFDTSIAYFLPAFLVSCMAAYRLARFNISEGKPDRFNGIPSPAMALFVACLPMIIFYSGNQKITNLILNSNVLYAIIVVLSYLMVSSHQLFKLSPKAMNPKKNAMRFVLIALSIISILLLKWMAALVIMPAYLILSKIEFSFLNKE
jgi:CDP-diacylglycerol---serine O-phosphatidyltransferase